MRLRKRTVLTQLPKNINANDMWTKLDKTAET